MRSFLLRIAAIVFATGLGTSGPVVAQEFDLSDIFSNNRFYRENGILQARGDVAYLANAWYLPGPDDTTQVLIGISLSNSSLQFVRTTAGTWQANYRVTAVFTPEGAGQALEQTWDKALEVDSFDESLLTSETIVFQTELSVVPGEYRMALIVRDTNADHASRVSSDAVVPSFAGDGPVLGPPVLLRLFQQRDDRVDFVVHPSHYYASAPPEFAILVEIPGATPEDSPYRIDARVTSATGSDDEALATWTGTVEAEPERPTRAFISIENRNAKFGEHRLQVVLTDAQGGRQEAEVSFLIAGSSAWLVENWDEALSLIRWEATSKERNVLKRIDDPIERLEAWNCFWRMRDPVSATATNEALQDYFSKIHFANQTWRSALRQGYLSDRGMVYITLGPPDDVVERPMPSGTMPYEVWTYYRNNFQIVFVDRIGFNNYEVENRGTYQHQVSLIERRKLRFLQERADLCPLLEPAFN